MYFHFLITILLALVQSSAFFPRQSISQKDQEKQALINSFAVLLVQFIPPSFDKSAIPFATYLKNNPLVVDRFMPILRSKLRLPSANPPPKDDLEDSSTELAPGKPSYASITLLYAFTKFPLLEVFKKFGSMPILKKIAQAILRACQSDINNLREKQLTIERLQIGEGAKL